MKGKVVNYNFEWDYKKTKKNVKKHKVSFERAATVFLDANAISLYDKEHEEIEERWVTIGMDNTGNLVVVCHTFLPLDNDTANIRMISARKPTKKEILQYKELL